MHKTRRYSMSSMLEYIKSHKTELFETILNEISEYIYRNSRYDVKFSLVAVYCEEICSDDIDILEEKLRKTDKIIRLNDHLLCIILDGISAELCAKAAENVNYHLLEMHANRKYYLSAADSQNYNPTYKNMVRTLFDRLEYAIENNLDNIVIYQDYVI